MSIGLHQVALVALFDKNFERYRRSPVRFVERCVEQLHGDKFSSYFCGRVRETYYAFGHTPFFKVPEGERCDGDILFFLHQGEAERDYMGIVLPRNRVAGVFTFFDSQEYDARHIMKIDKLGYPVGLLRLPQVEK